MKSLLFTPGNNLIMMKKSLNTGADALIFDLEDAVTPQEKEVARQKIIEILKEKPKKKIYIRTNALDTKWIIDDIAVFSRFNFAGFVIPKVRNRVDVEKISWLMDILYQGETGVDRKTIIPIIETPEGVIHLNAIADSTDRVEAVMFGALDYIQKIRGSIEDEFSLSYARSQLVNACRWKKIQPIDSVYPKFKNQEGLISESKRARAMGFGAKACIHPAQIEIINSIFAANQEEIEWAKKILHAFEAAQEKGLGVVQIDGLMVDLPVAENARQILAESINSSE
ncbi:HpcH/HpaI aldolase/citrate lyase family protein [Desulfitibacter alkalitolerans]|uniref:HpcH/HpaI aldolase/citrate lyase family protein n=1 Tax=Desulfitibacter alkalitolerans TaxID=264641 RepID=UPI00146FA679|nr:CoA ester lyase [Desulfitibacter alkalitolerans]